MVENLPIKQELFERLAALAPGAVLATNTSVLPIGGVGERVGHDVPGFIGNRLQHALWREAMALVAEGVCDAETVDLVVRNTIGLRLGTLGPLENADYIGLDLTLAIHDAVIPSLNHDPHPSPLLRELVAAGQHGARTGHGFIDWPAGPREATTARLAHHITAQLENRRET